MMSEVNVVAVTIFLGKKMDTYLTMAVYSLRVCDLKALSIRDIAASCSFSLSEVVVVRVDTAA